MVAGKTQKEWTLLELLNWTTEYFEEKGIEDARLNAEILLSEVMGMERVMLYARFEKTLPAENRRKFRKLVSRRADREPLQYLLGSTEFYGREFEITPDVLVPRPETELLVEKCLDKIPEDAEDFAVADIGTGSGVIALTLACERPGVDVLAIDSSQDALGVAGSNARSLGIGDRVKLVQGHLCDPVTESNTEFDLIASNPPYIPSSDVDGLQPEVSDWEPRQALDGGEDGLDAIREIVHDSPAVLVPGGWIVLELGEGQGESVRELVSDEETLDEASIETVMDDNCVRVMAIGKKTS